MISFARQECYFVGEIKVFEGCGQLSSDSIPVVLGGFLHNPVNDNEK